MILSHEEILQLLEKRVLDVTPLKPQQVRENGIDLTVANEYAVAVESFTGELQLALSDLNKTWTHEQRAITNVKRQVLVVDRLGSEDIEAEFVRIRVDRYVVIPPRSFALLVTREYIRMPNFLIGLCNLRSSLARLGLLIPPTVVDAGFEGQLVIEVFNTRDRHVALPVGLPFLHLVLMYTRPTVPYTSVYRGQTGVRLSDPSRLKPLE